VKLRRVSLSLVALATIFVASSVHARRQPAPGGKVTVALPAELVGPTTEAHLYMPLVEPMPTNDAVSALLHPALPGLPGWRSAVLNKLTSEKGGRVWHLSGAAPVPALMDALTRCLRADDGAWPADVLRAASAHVDVTSTSDEVLLRFSVPVGPVPDLLAGCPLRNGAGSPATGPFVLVSPNVLAWRNGGYDEAPLLGVIELLASGDRADLSASSTDASPSAGTLLAPFPDVVVLLQSRPAIDKDALGLRDPAVGTRGFRQSLRGDLLVAAYGAGRGTDAYGLLPPGIAPARPLPEPQGAVRLQPLSLAQLPANAPRVALKKPEGDTLTDGVFERLAVLLRNRGFGVDVRRADKEGLTSGVELMRWRPPTLDPALALLSLAGRRPELAGDTRAAHALEDPRMLSEKREDRLAAALALERVWLDAGNVVPLLTVDRWFSIDPDLRGVVLRADGVPLLDDAYWGGGR
jgi:hypothetical protein